MKMKSTMSFQERAKLGIAHLSEQRVFSFQEMKEQANRLKKQSEESFAKAAPMIQEELKLIRTLLTHIDAVHIYRWLFRNQITLEMISKEAFDEFKET